MYVNYNSPNQNADIHQALGEREPRNVSEQVEHLGISNVAMFAWHLGFEWNTVERVRVVAAYRLLYSTPCTLTF